MNEAEMTLMVFVCDATNLFHVKQPGVRPPSLRQRLARKAMLFPAAISLLAGNFQKKGRVCPFFGGPRA
jgi:hypothetical protein